MQLYEQRFGFTYIVCATGKSAEEMLAILKRRLASNRDGRVARGRRAAAADHADSSGKVAGRMSTITTHVLDTVLGKPAAGISVRLEKQEGGGWQSEIAAECRPIRSRNRCRRTLPRSGADAPPGVYRLTFDTGAYLARIGRTSIYPEISITFTCDGEAHYHLPLLLSDNSYTTYRGS